MADDSSDEEARILRKISMEDDIVDVVATSSSGNASPVTTLGGDSHVHGRVVRSVTWATPRGEEIPERTEGEIRKSKSMSPDLILNATVANPIASPRTLESTLNASVVSSPPVDEEPTELPCVEKDFRSGPQVCAFDCSTHAYSPPSD